jgi:hypothetical protein
VGIRRGQLHFDIFGERPSEEFELTLRSVLHTWPAEASPRFVQLFAELSALAAAARKAADRSPLSEDEIRSFLAHSCVFFDSYRLR